MLARRNVVSVFFSLFQYFKGHFCGGAAGIFYRNNIQMITSASGNGVVTGKLAGDQQQIYRIGFSGFLRF